MLIKRPPNILASEITPEAVYLNRRQFMQRALTASLTASIAATTPSLLSNSAHATETAGSVFPQLKKDSPFNTDEELTDYDDVTGYNNFYEFGTSKSDPARYAKSLNTRPWSIDVEGECEQAGSIDIEDILKLFTMEERIYRLRCVEGWSMVIPWIGFPLADLLKRFKPTSKAKYVEFVTLQRPKEMVGQQRDILDWPYVEGLRMDEAMHPLTILSVGLYGKVLPNQNGAPIRLVVPWKYGFKSIKSIVKIRFLEQQPVSTWTKTGPQEYGFYSNVNPDVPHPRWSQARERRIGDFFKRDTLMFNGYATQVAELYSGMDLRKYY